MDHCELVAAVALAVCEGFGGEGVGVFEGVGEGTLYDGGEECRGIVADGEGAAVMGAASGFWDGDAGCDF